MIRPSESESAVLTGTDRHEVPIAPRVPILIATVQLSDRSSIPKSIVQGDSISSHK